MKYGFPLVLLIVLAASLALPQSTANSHTTKTASPAKKTTGSAKKGKTAAKRPVASAPYRQMAPTPQRYKEIQQALADKGYLKSEPNGVWDTESSEALRQFQTEHNLSPTGKLSSASLIGLGLGPTTAAPLPDQPSVSVEAPSASAPNPAAQN
jgi:peptidoglycan hydrolase-like protein with peptidoglycan-binding domain